MKKILFLSVLALGVFSSCSDDSGNKNTEVDVVEGAIAKNVDVVEFSKLVESGEGQIIDVRTPGEVAEGYIKGAKNIDIYDPNFKTMVSQLNKEIPVYVYCKSGGRSGQAMEEMKGMGFKTIYNLDGGFGAWDNTGNETVK